jgi:hypothetical protein
MMCRSVKNILALSLESYSLQNCSRLDSTLCHRHENALGVLLKLRLINNLMGGGVMMAVV